MTVMLVTYFSIKLNVLMLVQNGTQKQTNEIKIKYFAYQIFILE